MASSRLLSLLLFPCFLGCSHHPRDLQVQLKDNFSGHVKRTDSSMVLDSFRVVWVDSVNERFGRVMDDTLFSRQQDKIRHLLANTSDKDSIEFYQYEMNYISKEIDSLEKLVTAADTIKKYGLAVKVYFKLTKAGRTADNDAYYFLDRNMNVLDADLIDSVFIKEAYSKIR